jgi:hypothetical protein
MQKLGRGETSDPAAKQRISPMSKYGAPVALAGRIWVYVNGYRTLRHALVGGSPVPKEINSGQA